MNISRVIKIACCSGLFLVANVSTYSADFDNGKRLHDENCMRCHQAEIYTRENSIISSLEDLDNRVRQCELTNEMAWFDEDVDDVVNYLNISFYLFQVKQ